MDKMLKCEEMNKIFYSRFFFLLRITNSICDFTNKKEDRPNRAFKKLSSSTQLPEATVSVFL